jgi:hypothetical protein
MLRLSKVLLQFLEKGCNNDCIDVMHDFVDNLS